MLRFILPGLLCLVASAGGQAQDILKLPAGYRDLLAFQTPEMCNIKTYPDQAAFTNAVVIAFLARIPAEPAPSGGWFLLSASVGQQNFGAAREPLFTLYCKNRIPAAPGDEWDPVPLVVRRQLPIVMGDPPNRRQMAGYDQVLPRSISLVTTKSHTLFNEELTATAPSGLTSGRDVYETIARYCLVIVVATPSAFKVACTSAYVRVAARLDSAAGPDIDYLGNNRDRLDAFVRKLQEYAETPGNSYDANYNDGWEKYFYYGYNGLIAKDWDATVGVSADLKLCLPLSSNVVWPGSVWVERFKAGTRVGDMTGNYRLGAISQRYLEWLYRAGPDGLPHFSSP